MKDAGTRMVEGATALGLASVAATLAFFLLPLEPRPSPNGLPSTPAVPSAAAREEVPDPVAPRTAPTPSSGEEALEPRRHVSHHARWQRDDALFLSLQPAPREVTLPPGDLLRLQPVGSVRMVDGRGLAADRFARAIDARRSRLDVPLLDIPQPTASTEQETGAILFLLGADRHARGDVEGAATYYEAFARHHPEADGRDCSQTERREGICPDAATALENAIVFRRALGQGDRALDAAALYVARYGETRIADASRVSQAAGQLLEDEGAHVEALHHWHEHLRRFGRIDGIDAAIQARVGLGRAQWSLGDRRAATRSFRRALRTWRAGASERLATSPDGDAFARTLDAVGEAAFHLAELRWAAFRSIAIDLPGAEGAELDGIAWERWRRRELHPWLLRKARALRAARTGYERVAALGATRWRVASEARIGQLHGAFADALRRIPARVTLRPESETGDGLVVVDDWRARAVGRLLTPAVEAFERCLDTAHRTRQLDGWAATCAEELTRLDPGAHPAMPEILPRGLRVHDGPAHDVATSGTRSG